MICFDAGKNYSILVPTLVVCLSSALHLSWTVKGEQKKRLCRKRRNEGIGKGKEAKRRFRRIKDRREGKNS